MKRLVRSRSGKQTYGPKWHNIESTDQIASVSDSDAGITATIPTSPPRTAVPETNGSLLAPPNTKQNDERTSKVDQKGSLRSCRESMYKAALEDDWLAAEVLLDQDPSLLCDKITEKGDRVLHVAVAMNHKEFVQEAVERMSPSDIEKLFDGYGYTACCYAAISGEVEIADVLMKKNPNLGTARDQNHVTPLQKAASRGNAELVSYFLESSKVEDLLEEEWFDLLLLTIRRKMYDVALKVLQKNDRIASMRNEEGTALHLLAQQEIFNTNNYVGLFIFRRQVRNHEGCLLAEKLWAEIQKLGEASVVELMKNPPILHDAAKVGNVELISMLTRAFPNLIWHTDDNQYSIFHIAVIYQQEYVFNLIYQIGATKDLIAITQDEDGNNILHLAGKPGPPEERIPLIHLRMQRAIVWFKKVEAIVPPLCLEMKNNEGETPRELFTKEHKSLLEKSETWMKNIADSGMLIATIMLTLVFAVAFTVPGGSNQDTGTPVLFKRNWFTIFIISDAVALYGSVRSILWFWLIMAASFREEEFLYKLPAYMTGGYTCMVISLVGVVSAFVSAYFLVFQGERAVLIMSTILLFDFCLVFSAVKLSTRWSKSKMLFREHTLFRQQAR